MSNLKCLLGIKTVITVLHLLSWVINNDESFSGCQFFSCQENECI